MNTNLNDEMQIILDNWCHGLRTYQDFHKEVLGNAWLTKEQVASIVVAMIVAEFQRAIFSIYEGSVNAMLKPFSELNSALTASVGNLLISDSALATGNPTVPKLGNDFRRVGLIIWAELEQFSSCNVHELKNSLTYVIEIRNMIVHGRGIRSSDFLSEIDLDAEVFTPLDRLVTLIGNLAIQQFEESERSSR